MARNRTWAYRQTREAILTASTICHICGEPGADATDHIVPIAAGGTDDPWNLRPAHHDTPNSRGVRCNRAKAARDPDVTLTTSRDW